MNKSWTLNRQNKGRMKLMQNKIYNDYWQGKRLVRDLDIAFLFKHAHLFILMAHEERSTQRIFIIKLLKWRFINTAYIDILLWRDFVVYAINSSHYEMDNSHSERVLIELSIQTCKRAQLALYGICTCI